MNAADKIMRRIEALAKISEVPGKLTRTFGSPAMRRANRLVGMWMRAAGMRTRVDAMGNLIGRREAGGPGARTVMLGSHLDTVRDAGKFDGPLGVLLGIACVEQLRRRKVRLPFAVEVAGFADEEGVRFQSAYLGSRALAGGLSNDEFRRKDAEGITLATAIRQGGGDPRKLRSARMEPGRLLAYIEAHIEQGPVLERRRLATGVVTGIAGQTRVRVRFTGRAGHAGTTPMAGRRDALAGAAELVLAAERLARQTRGAVATVGEIGAVPGASNVIPGAAELTLDIRHERDAVRQPLVAALARAVRAIARRRKLAVTWTVASETAAVRCDPELSGLLGRAVLRRQRRGLRLPSGAGHDAAAMARIAPVAMLFIRCKNGVSHHPDESVAGGDVRTALAVLEDFLEALAGKKNTGRPGPML